jgi:putative Mg2+ transporter-C (MgtC) family protein
MNPIESTITLGDVAFRLGIAMVIGAVLGINRDLRGKPAGLRTLGLVSVGASLLTIVSIAFGNLQRAVDPGAVSRVAQGIITGIGFLGAGVILRGQTEQDVHGLTTAASVWLSACLGIACGAGQWQAALVGLAITLFVLIVGGPIEQWIYTRLHRTDSAER